MAVRIRLTRHGKTHAPFYRIVVASKEKPRDGKFLEIVGTYDPRNKNEKLKVDKERIAYWQNKGATPTETVSNLLKTL
ncbi:MAG: 30S ribosomal protein S16 [Pseudomonadota bacterium]